MDSLHQHGCLVSLQASTHCIQGWDTLPACICSPDNGPEGEMMQSKSSYTYIELHTKGGYWFYWHPPQSAVAVLARGSQRWNANTALWVEISLFGLPCQDSTAGERELHTIANIRPLLCCQQICCFYTYLLRTAVVGVPRVMQIYHWFRSFHEYNG